MSWQNMEGKWKQFSADIKHRWAELTDDDIAACKADRQKLIGKLQELYGMTDEEAEREVAAMERKLHEGSEGAERLYGAK